jgi:hypothetical protein
MNIAEVVENVLAHHGVKGQKWGVRRKATVGAQEVVVSDKRKKLKTKGGQGHPAHSDAIGKATTGQILKKSGAKALSNNELKSYNERMNLEANAHRLSQNDMSPGRRFVSRVILQHGKQQITDVSGQVASHQVKKHLVRRLAKAGAVAAVA